MTIFFAASNLFNNASVFLRTVTLHPMASPGRSPQPGILLLVMVFTGADGANFSSNFNPFLRWSSFFPAPMLRVTFAILIFLITFSVVVGLAILCKCNYWFFIADDK